MVGRIHYNTVAAASGTRIGGYDVDERLLRKILHSEDRRRTLFRDCGFMVTERQASAALRPIQSSPRILSFGPGTGCLDGAAGADPAAPALLARDFYAHEEGRQDRCRP